MTLRDDIAAILPLLQAGNLPEALARTEALLDQHPNEPNAEAVRGFALLAAGDAARAAGHLETAAKALPQKPVLMKLAEARELSGDPIAGLRAREQAASLGQPTGGELYALGHKQEAMHRFDAARTTFRTLLGHAPDVPEIAIAAARLERIGGDRDAARAILDRAGEKHPGHPALLADRIELGANAAALGKAETLSTDETTPPDIRQRLAFALARHFDRVDDEEKAWAFASLGNGLYLEPPQPIAAIEAEIDGAFDLYAETKSLAETDGAALLYLIGPPRSGGTLLQTLLSAPAGHASLGERGALLGWLFSADAARFAADAEKVRRADLRGMEALFPDAALFTDKTPHHAHVAGLVHRLHPHARFIDQRRDPRDTLVSIYLMGFKDSFGYTRRTEDISAYLSLHRRTVARWADAGLPIESFDHDAFLQAPKSAGKALFEELGLTWDDSLLDNRDIGNLRTFSIDQARDEIARPKRPRHERYAPFAEEAFAALDVISFDTEASRS